MRAPSPPYCRLDLAPPWADRFIVGVAPIDYGPELLRKPFGFHLAMDTLPSAVQPNGGCRSALICCRLSPLCPFRLLHTFRSSAASEALPPLVGYSAPHPGAGGTPTLLNYSLLSAHYGPLRLPAGHRNRLFIPGLGRGQLPDPRPAGPPKFLGVLSVRAVSFHPGESAWASSASCFPGGAGFILYGGLTTLGFPFRGRFRVRLRYGSHLCLPRLRALAHAGTRSVGYMSLMLFYMANSFHLARAPRLLLAHHKQAAPRQAADPPIYSGSPG
jgi:hypothetical protein